MALNNDKLLSQIRFMEETLASAEVRASRALMASLLSDEFREFGASGRVFDKSEILDLLAEEPSDDTYQVAELRITALGEDTCLATYRILPRTVERVVKPGSNRSSVWRKEDGVWRLLFHQGTRLP